MTKKIIKFSFFTVVLCLLVFAVLPSSKAHAQYLLNCDAYCGGLPEACDWVDTMNPSALANLCVPYESMPGFNSGQFPGQYTSGSFYCSRFGGSGAVLWSGSEPMGNVVADTCSIDMSFCSGPTTSVCNGSSTWAPIGLPLSYTTSCTTLGTPFGAATGYWYLFTGTAPFTCCATGYPSTFGVCPVAPVLDLKWSDNSTSMTINLPLGGQASVPFSFSISNIGLTGRSSLNIFSCDKSASGVSISNWLCDTTPVP
jgi:hypothetical protein